MDNLNNQLQFRLETINKIEEYFIAEIRERALMSKTLSKYTAVFDYFDKALIVLFATSGGLSIVSFATVFGAPVGIPSAVLVLYFLWLQK